MEAVNTSWCDANNEDQVSSLTLMDKIHSVMMTNEPFYDRIRKVKDLLKTHSRTSVVRG